MNTVDKIVHLLKKNRDGLTVVEISRLLKISRNTASVGLALLTGEGKIRIRPVGVAKLHYLIGREVRK